MIKYLLAATAALALAAPVAAQAQAVPSYAAQADQQIQGRVTAFDGAYSLEVQDASGYDDNVQLHDGTIINPTGLTLAPGMVVSMLGQNDGSFFAANEIDTPYVLDAAVPYYDGRPWTYFGPSFSLGFFFGNGSSWHRDVAFGGPARFGGRATAAGNVTIVNREGTHAGADAARYDRPSGTIAQAPREIGRPSQSASGFRGNAATTGFRASAAAPARGGTRSGGSRGGDGGHGRR